MVTNVNEGKSFYAVMDKCRIQNILQVLIDNAIMCTSLNPQKRIVEVVSVSWVVRSDEQIIITVKDSGIGVKKKNIPLIFRLNDGSS